MKWWLATHGHLSHSCRTQNGAWLASPAPPDRDADAAVDRWSDFGLTRILDGMLPACRPTGDGPAKTDVPVGWEVDARRFSAVLPVTMRDRRSLSIMLCGMTVAGWAGVRGRAQPRRAGEGGKRFRPPGAMTDGPSRGRRKGFLGMLRLRRWKPVAEGARLEHSEEIRGDLVLSANISEVSSVAVTADGRFAVSGGGKTVWVWDLAAERCLHVLEGHTVGVTSVAVSADGRFVVSGSWDWTVRVWNLRKGRQLRILRGHTEPVESVAVSGDGRIVVAGGHRHDARVLIWDRASGRCLHTLQDHPGGVPSVAVSADASLALSGCRDDPEYSWTSRVNAVRMWDLSTGRCLRTIGTDSWVKALGISTDGRLAIAATDVLQVWDLTTGDALHTLGDSNYPVSVAMSGDGRFAVSADDKTVRVWDVAAERCLHVLEGHTSRVTSVALSADGRRAVSGGRDGTVRVWDLARR